MSFKTEEPDVSYDMIKSVGLSPEDIKYNATRLQAIKMIYWAMRRGDKDEALHALDGFAEIHSFYMLYRIRCEKEKQEKQDKMKEE